MCSSDLIVAAEYAAAGYRPEDVDTGAVIITGESARKENAAAVLERLSAFAGEFVVSTAGPDLESVIAGKGSGAWQASKETHGVTANLDIGGGTTNIVVFRGGEVAAKGCYDIGGRLIRLRADGPKTLIEYVSPAAASVAESLGIRLQSGQEAVLSDLTRITDAMAELLGQAMGRLPRTELLEAVRTPESADLQLPETPVERLFFSGGVADYLYALRGTAGMQEGGAYAGAIPAEEIPHGDIGRMLGRSLAQSAWIRQIPVAESAETIRATVVGAGTYTTTISGSTISYAETLFPIKNVPAMKLTPSEQNDCFAGHRGVLSDKTRWFLEQSASDNLILALPGKKNPSYPELKDLAAYIAEEMDASLPPGKPLLIVLEQDMAKALGILIEKALAGRRPVACIDGIQVEDNDYVDMGRPLFSGLVVPVVVKTLLFG